MTTFGWKRKIGQKVSREASDAFSNNAKEDDQLAHNPDDHNVQNFKRRKMSLLEECKSKSLRLKNEGEMLAENERYWEAIKKWDKAIQLTPTDEKLYEMKAQVLMQLNEVFPAVQAAEKAVEFNPRWWVGYQTLGRTQLGIGEIKLAIKSFSRALHINPLEKELWEEDLKWALALWDQKTKQESEINDEKETQKTSDVT
ncbi:tetratricopeptide repeat protein 33-like isoform X2 [Centruroides sculpturatus]|nr:tetratricopeptide repeat protein 33-like isoform X2 [Centruroides sculpturatus]